MTGTVWTRSSRTPIRSGGRFTTREEWKRRRASGAGAAPIASSRMTIWRRSGCGERQYHEAMKLFSDRLADAIRQKGNPCVVGLDPRIDQMPAFVRSGRSPTTEAVRSAITDFHDLVLDTVAPLVPAVKPQLAFFEQYGAAGMLAFEDTVRAA